jgi:hypothetical protein|tara:strand:+ start:705 stop:1682 length:978 start_codon:yes stop_codon:yes gene_type:complete
MFADVKKPELARGLKFWKNKNTFSIIMLHYAADPNKDPERDGAEWVKEEKKGVTKAAWNKEYEIDFTTKSGKLIYGNDFCDFDPKIHFISAFEHQEPYEQLLSLDFGQRNPTCALVGIWTQENVLYIVDEYYKAGLPSYSSKYMFEKFSPYMGDLIENSLSERRRLIDSAFGIRVIDPSTRAKNRVKKKDGEEEEYSVIEEFYDHGWDFEPGNNDVDAGITRVREYFQLNEDQKAHLYIFKDKCPNLCWELEHYRYQEYTEIQQKSRNKSEQPVKKDDHAVDTLRYMMMTRPNTPQNPSKPKTRIQKDIANLLKPQIITHNWDQD